MRKTKKNYQSIPDPYEDMIRINKLDPYEGLIKSNNLKKKIINQFNKISFLDNFKI